MYQLINDILLKFLPEFKRTKTWRLSLSKNFFQSNKLTFFQAYVRSYCQETPYFHRLSWFPFRWALVKSRLSANEIMA